jgi:hypothetical protein
MADISKIKKRMAVIAADGHRMGYVARMAGSDRIRLTSLSASHGYDHLIPVAWVSQVDKYVYLSKASRFVADNWENAPAAAPRKLTTAALIELGATPPTYPMSEAA